MRTQQYCVILRENHAFHYLPACSPNRYAVRRRLVVAHRAFFIRQVLTTAEPKRLRVTGTAPPGRTPRGCRIENELRIQQARLDRAIRRRLQLEGFCDTRSFTICDLSKIDVIQRVHDQLGIVRDRLEIELALGDKLEGRTMGHSCSLRFCHACQQSASFLRRMKCSHLLCPDCQVLLGRLCPVFSTTYREEGGRESTLWGRQAICPVCWECLTPASVWETDFKILEIVPRTPSLR